MFELTDKQKEDLKYLRSLENIVIPSEYTYWCHNTMYKPTCDCSSIRDKRCWNEIPTDKFVIKREMSFVTRMQRVKQALDYGNSPSLVYTNEKNSWPFQIRVLQPKHEFISSLYVDEQDQRKHFFCERGLGDGRHPKLPGNTEIFVFAFDVKDDVSDGVIDIVYCVTKEDISRVADLVRKLANKETINLNMYVVDNVAYEYNCPTIIEKKDCKERFFDIKIELDDVSMIKEAGYKTDYKNLKKSKR